MASIKHLIEKVSECGCADSPEGRMERFELLFEYLLLSHSGNLCEIGAGVGLTTRIMLKAAKQRDRKVLVIDPFENEWDSMPPGYGNYPFSVFSDNTIGYRDQLVLCRNNSMSSYATDAMMATGPFAFVFLDGLQYHDNVLREIQYSAWYGASIICVDDINRNTSISQVPSAVAAFLEKNSDKYELVKTRPLIEGYLIRKV